MVVVEIVVNFGLNEVGYVVLLKVIVFVGYVMILVLILQCWWLVVVCICVVGVDCLIFLVVGNVFVDVWVFVLVFIVMVLWFVWVFDVYNGYCVLIMFGGCLIVVMIVMWMVLIVVFGVFVWLFQCCEDDCMFVYLYVYCYYLLLCQIVFGVIGVVIFVLLLQIWGVLIFCVFEIGMIGYWFVFVLVMIVIVVIVVFVVWEVVNIVIECCLQCWMCEGNLVCVVWLCMLLLMLCLLLFVMIVFVVVLMGFSEFGVNVGLLLVGVSIFGVVLGFGLQKLVQDFIIGIFLLMENVMQVGDWVMFVGVLGMVEYLLICIVWLCVGDGLLYMILFSLVMIVNNMNCGFGNVVVKVSIVYGEDIDCVIVMLKEIGIVLCDDLKYYDGILLDFSYWGIDQVDGVVFVLVGQMQCMDLVCWSVQCEFNWWIVEMFCECGIWIVNLQCSVVVYVDGLWFVVVDENDLCVDMWNFIDMVVLLLLFDEVVCKLG